MHRKEVYKGYCNKVYFIAGLKEVPEIRATSQGGYVATVDVVTKHVVKNPKTEKFEDQNDWHTVVLYDELAKNVARIGRPGMRFLIEGPIQSETYEGQDGRFIKDYKIIANVFEPMDPISSVKKEKPSK